ncbi:MAG: helix-turn-helix transcriptional regulator [Candidatus Thiodiazotropha sp. (ex Monitilora ramsayi)]|nr:helix-turn-helix transcriptional regulator [Candidatus Thiodiazotropha sp. (ex Monitilora ramsayi)]
MDDPYDFTADAYAKQLRELERDGLISRKIYPEIPPRVEYSITEMGLSIGPTYKAIHQWQQKNVKEIEKKLRRI